MRLITLFLRALRVPAAALIAVAAVMSAPVRPAQAQLKIEITSGVTDPVPIAVAPFGRAVPAGI